MKAKATERILALAVCLSMLITGLQAGAMPVYAQDGLAEASGLVETEGENPPAYEDGVGDGKTPAEPDNREQGDGQDKPGDEDSGPDTEDGRNSGGSIGEAGHITGFAPLPDDVAVQVISLGFSGQPELPDTLEATVDGETEQVTVARWDAEPAFDGEAAGEYTFTPVLGRYTLADGVDAPKITVHVTGAMRAAANAGVDIDGKTVMQAQADIQAALDAANSGDTVIVTGTIGDADGTLSLTIDAGVTLRWEASITASDFVGPLQLYGSGTFEVANGGAVRADALTATAIDAQSAVIAVKVSGSSTVSARIAIETGGAVVIRDSEVSGNIYAQGDVVIRDSEVAANISAYAGGSVLVEGSRGVKKISASYVEVLNSQVHTGTGYAISSMGDIVVLNSQVRSDSAGNAIDSGGDVTVQGSEVYAGNGAAIVAYGDVTVSGSSKLVARDGFGIAANSSTEVQDSDVSSDAVAILSGAVIVGGASRVQGGGVCNIGQWRCGGAGWRNNRRK